MCSKLLIGALHSSKTNILTYFRGSGTLGPCTSAKIIVPETRNPRQMKIEYNNITWKRLKMSESCRCRVRRSKNIIIFIWYPVPPSGEPEFIWRPRYYTELHSQRFPKNYNVGPPLKAKRDPAFRLVLRSLDVYAIISTKLFNFKSIAARACIWLYQT